MNLQQRSTDRELLDGSNIPFADIAQNMRELNTVNTYLGGHAITIEGFKKLVGNGRRISVCEMGCGGGDNLAAIANWADKNRIHLSVIGIDMKEECIEFARSHHHFAEGAQWITSDYRDVQFTEKPDIIFSSLFCHHFTDAALVQQMQWMKENSRLGFFVNDLHRHALAYHSIRWLTRVFSSSYLVKNDAPLSVLRGFKRQELEAICAAAGLTSYQLYWKWAFRYLLIYKHG